MKKTNTVHHVLTLIVLAASMTLSYSQNPTKILKSESFNSYFSSATNGWRHWWGARNPGSQTDYSFFQDLDQAAGYSPGTTFAGGQPGEGGGMWRSGLPRVGYLDSWDVTNYLTLNDTLVSTGRVVCLLSNYIQGTLGLSMAGSAPRTLAESLNGTTAGTGWYPAGWMNVTNLTGNGWFATIRSGDPTATPDHQNVIGSCMGLRVTSQINPIWDLAIHGHGDIFGSKIKSSGPFTSTNASAVFVRDQKLRYGMKWDPLAGGNGGGLFTGVLYDDANGWSWTASLDLTPADRTDLGDCWLNCFGAFKNIPSPVSAGRIWEMYVDDMTYSACPNPAVWSEPGQFGGQHQATNIWITINANNLATDPNQPTPRKPTLVPGTCSGTISVILGQYVRMDQLIECDIVSTNPAVAYAGASISGTQHVVFPAGRNYVAIDLPITVLPTAVTTNTAFLLRNVTGPVGLGNAPWAGNTSSTLTFIPGTCSVHWTNIPVTVSAPVVSTLAAAPTVLPGSTNIFVTVSIPDGASCGGPISVDLVSTNLNIVPRGSVGGVLGLTFPTGGFSSTNVYVDASAALSATNTTWALANVTGPAGTFINPAQPTNKINVACGIVQFIGSTTNVTLLGSTNQPVQIGISPGLNLTAPVTVTLTSTNPAVAYPNGAPGGSMTVTFPAGAIAQTNIFITGAGIGTTAFILSSPSALGCADTNSNFRIVTLVVPTSITNQSCEDFDSPSVATANGWTEVGSRVPGAPFFTDFGYDATAVSGSPDAGGDFYQGTNRAMYADTTIGLLTLNDYISAHGYVFIDKLATNGSQVYFGFFNSGNSFTNVGNANGPARNMLAMKFEHLNTLQMQLKGQLQDATGSGFAWGNQPNGLNTPTQPVTAGISYEWQFTYDPTGGPLGFGQGTWTLPGPPFNGFTAIFYVTAAQRINGAVFDRFGFLKPYQAFGAANDTTKVYVDTVCYTIGTPVKITNTQKGGGQVTLTFISAASSHKVQKTVSLSPASWSDVTGVTFTGPATATVTGTAQFAEPTDSTQFYRIIANPNP